MPAILPSLRRGLLSIDGITLSHDEGQGERSPSRLMGGLGIACPGNRPHSDAIFGRARGSKRLGALTGVGHPTYPAIGVTLDQREATPFCGTSGTGSGSGLRAFQGAGTAGSPPQVPRDVASRVSARSRRGSLNPWSVAMGNQWLLLSRKT